MDTSTFLARLIGLMFIVAGAFVLINKDRIRSIVNSLHNDPALLTIAGMMNVLMGLLIVLSHNVWTGWPILITVIGYLIIVKGLLRLFAPEQNTELTNKMLEGQGTVITGGATLVVGIILTLIGFFG